MAKNRRAARAAKKTPEQAPNSPVQLEPLQVSIESGSDVRVFSESYAQPLRVLVGDAVVFDTNADADPAAPISPAVLKYLRGELAKAEATLVHGPTGQGWRYNETLREDAVEIATFLKSITNAVDRSEEAPE